MAVKRSQYLGSTKSVLAMRFDPVNECIYCRNESNPSKLSDEHIVPLSFGGKIVLPKSSCASCAKVIGQFEDACLKTLLGPARDQLGLPSRQRIKRKLLPVYVRHNGKVDRKLVPKDRHPSALLAYAMSLPGALFRQEWDKQPLERTDLQIIALSDDFEDRINEAGPGYVDLMLGREGHQIDYVKTIAKIAHGFGVGMHGINAFKPALPDIILGRTVIDWHHYIGSEPQSDQPEGNLHALGVVASPEANPNMMFVRVHLFAALGLRQHIVALGERT